MKRQDQNPIDQNTIDQNTILVQRIYRSAALAPAIAIASLISMIAVQAAWGQAVGADDLEIPPTVKTADQEEGAIAQATSTLVRITNIQVNSTDTGLSVILETPDGQIPSPSSSVLGNALILDIPDAVLVRTGDFVAQDSSIIQPLKIGAYVQHQTTPSWVNRLQLLAVGDRDRGFEADLDPQPIQGYVVLNLISSFDLGPGVLQVGVENLLDNQYRSVADQASFSPVGPEPGRTVRMSYSFSW